ncbi:hypothetical protein KKH30_02880, partial [Candidatus Micrarchaeota archaeon]|nr:hypothetical protein [Candidatus Micrarchaeota archaeon]MBU1939680.1 hypothetical protein [Candidatus Micrarchaeota archaeon]
VLVLLLVIQLFLGVSKDMGATQEEIGIRTQHRSIALGIERVLLSGIVMSSGGPNTTSDKVPFLIQYRVPMIKMPGGEAGCVVDFGMGIVDEKNLIQSTEISVESSTSKGLLIRTVMPMSVAKGHFNVSPNRVICGEVLEITGAG